MKPKAHAHSASSSLGSEARTFTRHSATVEMELRIADKVFRVGQLGPDFIILHEADDHPPATGEMMLRIDGIERRWHVYLPEGMCSSSPRVRTTNCSHPPPEGTA